MKKYNTKVDNGPLLVHCPAQKNQSKYQNKVKC